MKKFITLVVAVALASVVFGMSKAPSGTCGADKACAVKEAAACCTTDGSCKTDAGTCAAKKAEACADKTETCAKDAAKKAAECAGGTCPLTK